MQGFIENYGYIALFIGICLEGETLLLIAGFLAFEGYLDLPWVIFIAIAAAALVDNAFFCLGRHYGTGFIARRPTWLEKSRRIGRWINTHENIIMLLYRFMYGLRLLTPFVLGAHHVSPLKFFLFSLFSICCWASMFAVLGYSYGDATRMLLGHVREYETQAILFLAAVGLMAWIGYLVHLEWRRRHRRSHSEHPAVDGDEHS